MVMRIKKKQDYKLDLLILITWLLINIDISLNFKQTPGLKSLLLQLFFFSFCKILSCLTLIYVSYILS